MDPEPKNAEWEEKPQRAKCWTCGHPKDEHFASRWSGDRPSVIQGEGPCHHGGGCESHCKQYRDRGFVEEDRTTNNQQGEA
jgi:hypothetical protein